LRFPHLSKNQTIMRETIKVKASELLETIKTIIHEGNVNRIIIKNESGHTYIEIPVTVGILGIVIAPILAAVAAIASLAADFTIEIVRRED